MTRQITLEALERRALMSVTVIEGSVTVNGDDGNVVRNDAITLRRSASNPANLEILVNGQLQHTRAISATNNLRVFGLGGDDKLTIDNRMGAISLPTALPLQFDGGAGSNSVTIAGGTASSSGFFDTGTPSGGDVSRTINGQFQRLTFTNVGLVRELGASARFGFVGVASGTETLTLDNGTSSTDRVLRITHSTPGKTFATFEFSNKTELLLDTDQGSAFVRNPPGTIVLTSLTGDRDILKLKNTEAATGLTNLRVLTHQGADTVRIEGQNATIELNTGVGNDTIIVGKPGPLTGDGGGDGGVASRTLNVFASDITLSDTPDEGSLVQSPPDTDILTLDDGTDTNDNIGELTSNRISGLGLGGSVRYSGISTVNLQLGSGNDTLRVRSTAANMSYNVNGGVGNDLIRLGSLGSDHERGGGTVNAILGPMSVFGAAGKNTIIVDDSGETQNSAATLTDTTISGLGMADVTHFGINRIELLLGSGEDSVSNQLSPDSAIELLIDPG